MRIDVGPWGKRLVRWVSQGPEVKRLKCSPHAPFFLPILGSELSVFSNWGQE